jgi:maleylacetate reductase
LNIRGSDHRRIVIGEGSLDRLAEHLDEAGFQRPFIVTTRGRAGTLHQIQRLLGEAVAGVFSDAVEHVPVHVTDKAENALRETNADVILAVGGGSAIGLGKALVLRTKLPLVAIPTTYSGSEMTSIYGVTDDSGKKTGRNWKVAPRIIVYDPRLTLDLPPDISATSGINALAHSVEALYAPNATSLSDERAEQSIRLLGSSLPKIVEDPSNILARADALKGAQLAGEALDLTSMGLHHRICHVLGGTFGMPHAKTHSVVLRYVVAFNYLAAPDAMDRITAALDGDDAISAVDGLCGRLRVPRSLGELGFRAENIEAASAEIVNGGYPNPRKVTADAVAMILRSALSGDPPASLSQ